MPQHELLACAQCGCFAFSCFEDFAIRVNKADPPAFLSQIENEPRLESIKHVEVVEYEELGMEAIFCIDVEKFPAFIVVDDKGNDFFSQLS